jgi:hypothetical protein
MKLSDSVLDFIAWKQYEYVTGSTWLQYILQFLSYETFAMLFCAKFDITGIWALSIYAAAPPVIIVVGIVLGKLQIKSRYQERYLKICADMNPDWKKAMSKIEEVDKK